VRMQHRNSPIRNWVDRNSRHRIINHVLFEELYSSEESLWERRAKERLEFFGINLSEVTIRNYESQIATGGRDPVCASAFSEKSANGLASRSGKEIMYGQMDLLVDTFLSGHRKIYMGLPANQLLSIIRKYGSDVWACERNQKMLRFMRFLKNRFHQDSEAHIIDQDVFRFLAETKERFTIFDMDLMTFMSQAIVDKLAMVMNRTIMDRAVISIASCIGRKITEKKYRELMPLTFLDSLNLKTLASYSGGYCDSVVPMRYELMVVER